MTTTTSRRAVLAGIPAAAIVATGATAAVNPDVELFELYRKILAAKERERRAWAAAEALNIQSERLFTDYPEPLSPPPEYRELWKTVTAGEFATMPDDHPLKVWERETNAERNRAWAVWKAENDKLLDETGVRTAEEAAGKATSETFELAEQIFELPARTLDGVMVKVRACELVDGDDEDASIEPGWWQSIAADIRRLAGASEAVRS